MSNATAAGSAAPNTVAAGGAGGSSAPAAAANRSSHPVIFFDDSEKEVTNVREKCPVAKIIHVVADPALGINDAAFRDEMKSNPVYNIILENKDKLTEGREDPLGSSKKQRYTPSAGINASHIAKFREFLGDATKGTVVFDWDHTLNVNNAFYSLDEFGVAPSVELDEAYVELLCGGKERVKMLREGILKVCDERGIRKIILTSGPYAIPVNPSIPEKYTKHINFIRVLKQLVGSDADVYHTSGPFNGKSLTGANDRLLYDKGASFQALGLCGTKGGFRQSRKRRTSFRKSRKQNRRK